MIQEAGFYLLKAHIGAYAYGEEGIFEKDEYIDSDGYIKSSKGSWVDQPPRQAVLPLKRSYPLPDLLVGMPEFCVSERAYNIFIHKLRIWERITWISVRVINGKKREVGRYWWPVVWGLDFFDSLDMAHSDVEYYPMKRGQKKKAVSNVRRWVLSGKTIGDLDLFKGNKWQWFASPLLRNLVVNEKLTGFRFLPVDVSM
jgi:hypothetical protein